MADERDLCDICGDHDAVKECTECGAHVCWLCWVETTDGEGCANCIDIAEDDLA